jgi:hypothetical protein
MEIEAKERKQRYEKLLEALKENHKATVESRDDENSELKIRMADAEEAE